MHAEGSIQTAGRQDACRGEWPDSRQAGCMQRGVARRQAGRMYADCSREWPVGRQAVDSRQSAGRQLFFETGIFSQLYCPNRNLIEKQKQIVI
jgi:hypothetical protein